jgi:hypothetical protein
MDQAIAVGGGLVAGGDEADAMTLFVNAGPWRNARQLGL